MIMKLTNHSKYISTNNTDSNSSKSILLQNYGLENIANDQSFNNLLSLAKIICEVPIAYISIFDSNNQYIIAQDGFEFQTIPVQESVSQYTLNKNKVLVIEDIKKDSRTKNLPLFKQNPSINFYSGFPLITDKNNLGTFCIMDYKSRALSAKQEKALKLLSEETCKQFNLFGQNLQLEVKHHELKTINFSITQKRQELEAIIDKLPACISFVDLNYCYQINNKVYEDWFGVSKEALKGKHIINTIGKEKFQKLLPIFKRAFNGEIVEFETTLNAKKTRHLRVTYLPVLNYKNQVKGTFVFAEDLTEIKNYQEKLELSNQSLESFAYIASHDIKSPLKTIMGFGKILKADLTKNKIDYKQDYLDNMIETAQRLENLTKDLLSYAMVQNDQFKVEAACSFNEILNIVCHNLQTDIGSAEAIIDFKKTDIQLMVKETDLIQLLQNIISNGIKYQQKDNQPIVKIVTVKKAEHCEIIISDNGIGIEQENLRIIFQPFIRLHNHSTYTGTGLGLATCKKIIERYGSDLEVVSIVDKGTAFSFSLPLAAS